MRSQRTIIFAVVAVGLALAAAWFVRLALGSMGAGTPAPAADKPAETLVLVARQDLPIGRLLGADDIRAQPWPKNAVNDSYIVLGNPDGLKDYLGHVVRTALPAGTPVPRGALVAPGERGFLAAALAPGMRAVTLPVDAASGVAGFIFPGDRVDVILNHRVEDADGNRHFASETIAGNVRVLAIDSRTAIEDGKVKPGRTVTLEVTPKIAERIALVRAMGTITLALRSLQRADGAPDGDRPVAATVSHTWDADVSRVLPPPDTRNGTPAVRVVRGSESELVELAASRPASGSGS
ncbi:MAG: hypothetical protein KatS3mg119_0482 [Rhodothalassiaceae bacterium]|nr:MAG: hypothetical protein KatS3mg119_0482 [Rhodothalassiaceae bacterium]